MHSEKVTVKNHPYFLKGFSHPLSSVPEEMNEDPKQSFDWAEKLLIKTSDYKEIYGDDLTLEEIQKDWRHLQPDIFSEFSFEEKCKMYLGSVFASQLWYDLEKTPIYDLFYKLIMSHWHWGYDWPSWNRLVSDWNQMLSFDFGTDFDVYIDYSYSMYRGFGKHSETFFDGELAYLIYYKGEHVLTISFCPNREGILINQIQCKNKSGNRWIYKLGKTLFEYTLEKIQQTFKGKKILFVTGKGAAEMCKRSYGEDNPISKETYAYVKRIYSQRLTNIQRKRPIHRFHCAEFQFLEFI